jgi:hypothetical protein
MPLVLFDTSIYITALRLGDDMAISASLVTEK